MTTGHEEADSTPPRRQLEWRRPRVHPESNMLAPWFHNLHLPDGSQTAPEHPLGDFPLVKWRQIAPFVATDLGGWHALDVGCNAGFYSFELARRGAAVTAIDIDAHYLRQARWGARQHGLESRIEFRQESVYELARRGERYDLVWFLGVLYHLRHPLLALDLLREITVRQMALQTLTMPGESVETPPDSIALHERLQLTRRWWPHLAFIERALEGDPTNWWAPNHACVEAMVRSAGFVVKARPGHEIYLCEPNPSEPEMARELRRAELRALDIALFLDLAARANRSGIQEWLSFYFKSPMHAPAVHPEHDLSIQLTKLSSAAPHAADSKSRPEGQKPMAAMSARVT